MSANLPRVFEDVGSGNVKPVEVPLHLSKIGGDFNNEELVSVARETVRISLASKTKAVFSALQVTLCLLVRYQSSCGNCCAGQED